MTVSVTPGNYDGHVPDLDSVGIEEIEPGVCEDTYANRRKLRLAKWLWQAVTDEKGEYTGTLQVIDETLSTRRRLSLWERKMPLLSDSKDPWSDYLPAMELAADADIPHWVREAIREREEQAGQGVPRHERRPIPFRCEMVRSDGTRCWNWASGDEGVARCYPHLTSKSLGEDRLIQAAKLRLIQAAPAAVDKLEELMESAGGEAVRLRASVEILDRAGVRAGVDVHQSVDVRVTDASEEVRLRLERLAANAQAAQEARERAEAAILAAQEQNTIDAEVVSDRVSLMAEMAAASPIDEPGDDAGGVETEVKAERERAPSPLGPSHAPPPSPWDGEAE